MKTLKQVLAILFLLTIHHSINAQQPIIDSPSFSKTQTVESPAGMMLHDYLNDKGISAMTGYELGAAPEGDYPGDLFYSADGSKIYIANSYSNNITILNADGTVSDNVTVGSYPLTLALNDDYAVVPCSMSSDVYIIDLTDNSIAATITVNGEPVSVKIQGTKAYVGCDTDANYNDECAIIDLTTLTLENTITNFPVTIASFTWTFNNRRAIYNYSNFAVSDDNTYLIAGNWNDKINFYNTSTGAIDYDLNAVDVKNVDKSGDGSTLVGISPNNLYQVDIDTHTITDTQNLGGESIGYPYLGVANQDGSKAFIALNGNKTGFVNFTTNSVNTVSATYTPAWISVNSDRTKVFSGQKRFTVLDFQTEAVLGQNIGVSTYKGAVSPTSDKAVGIPFSIYEGPFFYDYSDLNNIVINNYVPTGQAPEGDAPSRIVVTPNGQTALITNELSHNLIVFDITSQTITDTIEFDGALNEIEVTSDGNYAVIPTGYIQSEIVIFDINQGVIVKEIAAGASLLSVEILPDDSKAYVRDFNNGLYVIELNGASSSLLGVINCGMGSYASHGYGVYSDFEVSPDGNYIVFAATWEDALKIIDTSTDTIIKTISVGDAPYFMAFNSIGDKLIATDIIDDHYTLIEIDGVNSSVINTFPVSGEMPYRVTHNPINNETGIMVYGDEYYNTGGQFLLVNSETGELISQTLYTEVDGNALQVLFDVTGIPIVLTEFKIITGDLEYSVPVKLKYMAYSPQNGVILAISPDNDYLYVADSATADITSYPINQNSFILHQNAPNPASGLANISYKLSKSGEVGLFIYDELGKLVQTHNFGTQKIGDYNFDVNISDFHSGVYYYKLTVNNQSHTKKMIVK